MWNLGFDSDIEDTKFKISLLASAFIFIVFLTVIWWTIYPTFTNLLYASMSFATSIALIGIYIKSSEITDIGLLKEWVNKMLIALSLFLTGEIIVTITYTASFISQDFAWFLVALFVYFIRDLIMIPLKWKLNFGSYRDLFSQPDLWWEALEFSAGMSFTIGLAYIFFKKNILTTNPYANIGIEGTAIILLLIFFIYTEYQKEKINKYIQEYVREQEKRRKKRIRSGRLQRTLIRNR
jgi:hypothetical protein